VSLEVITLGCRLNAADSAAMRAIVGGEDDLVIVNSCAVTNEAVRQTRQAIRRAKRARPDARVIVTGCAAQVEPETFAAMPEVSRVVGNVEKFEAPSFKPASDRPELVEGRSFLFSTLDQGSGGLRQAQADRISASRPASKLHVSDIFAVRETAPHLSAAFSDRARAFVEVQNGCDHRCTFCIIPYGRGNSRSVPAGLVIDRIKALVDEGFREVVLTGVDITSYGADLPGSPSLGLLVERILRHVPDLPRLRLSSIDCIEIDARLFDLITGEARVMPHLHLSLQAGDDLVLKRMKRRHSREQAVSLVERLKAKRPEIAIGADLIAGFPTETEEMAARSLALIDDCDIVMGHIFPYSPKSGTPAARMPQVPAAAIKARAKRLREASARRRAAWLRSLVGTRQRVLVEREDFGHSESFAPVRTSTRARSSRAKSRGVSADREAEAGQPVQTPFDKLRTSEAGHIQEVRITGVEADTLIGVPA
jgi:threonylcarbamoyladenosine tRNA methylthiotransferase MtaB